MGTPDGIKIRLRSRKHADVETLWAEDLGAIDGAHGARRVRLANIPCFHAKPTWGDVLIVTPDPHDGMLMWEAGEAGPEIAEDGGHWAMIVDYQLAPGGGVDAAAPRRKPGPRRRQQQAEAAFKALEAAAGPDIMIEGAYELRESEPGRAYFAVPAAMDLAAVLARLRAAELPLVLTVVHPDTCVVCGAECTKCCDHVTGEGETCGATLCDRHATPDGERDLCPTHSALGG